MKAAAATEPHPPQWLIATDLDGTLLDDTYPVAAAMRVLERLHQQHPVHLVLASSKTFAEMEQIAAALRIDVSLVFENGGGYALPASFRSAKGPGKKRRWHSNTLGREYDNLKQALGNLREAGFAFRGFADMSEQEVARRTGLSLSQSRLAKMRFVTEPIVWQDSAAKLNDFRKALSTMGLRLTQGGRFHHVSSTFDKSSAVVRIAEELAEGSPLNILACGDAPNDLTMLNKADHAVIFPRRECGYLTTDHDRFTQARRPGPAGWLISVTEALQTEGICA